MKPGIHLERTGIKEVSPKKVDKAENNLADITKFVDIPHDKVESKLSDFTKFVDIPHDKIEGKLSDFTKLVDIPHERGEIRLYNTEQERIDYTPCETSALGKWEAERGNSLFLPFGKEVVNKLNEHGVDGIDYKRGIVDFSPVSEQNVEIKMTSERPKNFEKADSLCAERWNAEKRDGKADWTARDIANWRFDNKYTWHECNDMKTCALVPRNVHEACRHLGGVSECKKREEYGGIVL